jgi:cytochrome c peroxidase
MTIELPTAHPRRSRYLSLRVYALALTTMATATVHATEPTEAQKTSFQRPATIPFPADNPYTPAKATLGKMLFFDTRLSRDRNLSCASCHNPSFGWEVPFAQAIGAGGKPLGRHAPTALNQAWSHDFFWDGRAGSLEAQARGPIESAAEMDLPLSTAVERLKAVGGYRRAFSQAFPSDGLTEKTVLKAIATFERTIVTPDTPFDRWVRGDSKALSDGARRGFSLFVGKANCAACHTGWNFTDGKFHDIGLPTDDKGRGQLTKKAEDDYAFKTPSLREIAARAPYMHKGQVVTLEDVVNHYITGGVARPTRSQLIKPIALQPQDVADLVEFMKSLSSSQATLTMPNLPAL